MDINVPIWLDEFIVPGAAVALIRDGDLILQRGYGYADVDRQIKVGEQTGFNIASISKTVAAWGVMNLVEDGTLELDAPVATYLTRWHLPESAFDVDGVTVRRLLSHTAGLSLHGYPGWTSDDTLPTIEESLSGRTNGGGDVQLIREPGSRFQYSGGGYMLLQLIVEEVSGQSFADYMQAEVLDPLGMTNSSYTIDEEILRSSSLEHDSYGDVIPFERFTAQAAAGLQTTIEDLSTFALASLQSPGVPNPVLEPSTLELMTSAAPESGGEYGLGYSQRGVRGSDEAFFGHDGSNAGWQATLRLHNESKSAFILLTNGATGREVIDQALSDWMEWNWTVDMSAYRRKPIVPLLVRSYRAHGIEEAVLAYREVKESNPEGYTYSEDDINLFGYQLMWADSLDAAIEVFKINVAEHPYSANPYDSYGEALLVRGDTTASIRKYLRSMELDPQNENGRRVLEELGVYVAPYEEPVSILDAPEGWGSEIIPFPIRFAPSIDLKGYEELRFTPAWRDSTSSDFWTMTFVWYVDRNREIGPGQLADYVEAYYDGLLGLRDANDQGAGRACQFAETENGLQCSIRVFDSFVTKAEMTLHINVEQRHCPETGKHLVQFKISPKEFGDPVWDALDAVTVRVACE